MRLQLTEQQSERMKLLMESEHYYSEQDFFNTLLDNFELSLRLKALRNEIQEGEQSGYQAWSIEMLRENIINGYAKK